MKFKPSYLPLSIILLGIIWSVYWQGQIPEGVYFSGDAGLKALLAKQLAAGIFRFDLVFPSSEWIEQLWHQGLYPYQEPFVYSMGDRDYITFPFTFPLITAPFYALFGYRGLYLIPLISTWAIWLNLYWLCHRLKFDNFSTSLALTILIFASPLTIYSAMYWEHTLAVALSFAGISILVNSQIASNLSSRNAVISGFLIGFSVWFRPELLALVGIVILGVILSFLFEIFEINFYRTRKWFTWNKKNFFIISLLLTIGLFFFCNQLIYHHPLGIHAIQIVEKISLAQRLQEAWRNFKQMSVSFIIYFPVTGFFFASCLFYFLFKNNRFRNQLILLGSLYGICLIFILGVSLLVPAGTSSLIPGGKQWGTRFLLFLVPIITLVTVQQLIYLKQATKLLIRYSSIWIIALLLILGIHKNSYQGTIYLQTSYQGILPAIGFLQTSPHQIIAISHQFVAQALQPSLEPDKIFFRVENREHLEKLVTTLREQNQQKFIYVCYPYRPCNLPKENPKNLEFKQRDRALKVKFTRLGKFGNYLIYDSHILMIHMLHCDGRSPQQKPERIHRLLNRLPCSLQYGSDSNLQNLP